MSYSCQKILQCSKGLQILDTFAYPDNVPICQLILDSDNNQICLLSLISEKLTVGYSLGMFNIEEGREPPKAAVFNISKNTIAYLSQNGLLDPLFNLETDNDFMFYPDVTVYMQESPTIKFCFDLSVKYFYNTVTVMMKGDRLDSGF